MKDRIEQLCTREVPECVDAAVLAASRRAAARIRFRRAFCRVAVGVAATLFIAVGLVVLLPGAKPAPSPQAKGNADLLAMADWDELDRESYNLSFETYGGSQQLLSLENSQLFVEI